MASDRPNPTAVRTLAQMLETERARADAREWIRPEDWPDEGARRVAARIMDGGKLKPCSPEIDALECAYWSAIAHCHIDGDAIAEMVAERDRVYSYGRELGMLADRLMSGKVGTLREAFQETIDAARAITSMDFAATARLTAEPVSASVVSSSGAGDRAKAQTADADTTDGWGWSKSEEVAA